jgi:hypothetical protein
MPTLPPESGELLRDLVAFRASTTLSRDSHVPLPPLADEPRRSLPLVTV